MSKAKPNSGKQGEESLGAGASVSADAGSSAIEFTGEPCISAIVPARNEEAVIGGLREEFGGAGGDCGNFGGE